MKTLSIISVTLLLWVGISTLEIACKNLEPNPEYTEINFYRYYQKYIDFMEDLRK